MGDPPKFRNKYERPKRLFDEDRLEEESGYKTTYGLKNMKELWMAGAELKKYRRQARHLLSLTDEDRSRDAPKILTKLNKLGILNKEGKIDDILSLSVKDILERRLQTIVMRKGLARTMAQSRQLITHGFISVDGRVVSRPSYLVSAEEEARVSHSKAIDIAPPQVEQPKKDATAKPKVAEAATQAAPVEGEAA